MCQRPFELVMSVVLDLEELKKKVSEVSVRLFEMESRERRREGEIASILGRLAELERR
jgi:hypothetical protein